VRGGAHEASVPVVATRAGAAVAIQRLAPALPLDVQPRPDRHFLVTFGAVRFDFADQVPFARVGNVVVPLAGAPFVVDGKLLVPYQVVSELLPRYAPDRVRYDAARRELRVTREADAPAAPRAPVVLAAEREAKRGAPSRPAPRRRVRRVVVDAGHGGPDNGMSGPIGGKWRMYEKDVTLAVAKKLRTALEARGVDVVMTRTTDTLIALSDRGRIANEAHGDVFVSIHVNAANLGWKKPAAARGYETYFLAEARTEDAKRVERMENESIRFETGASAAKSDPLNFIINDMAQNEHLRESSDLAELIQHRLGAMHPGPSRGVKQAGFRVLVTAFMPAVLVEIGFGTNEDEARWMTNGARQRDIANAIADATIEYLDHYERRLGTTAP
jgi:N-acetylmuramoyl-L-alanine amidase